jgi:sugar diacid utilization regulator
MSATDIRPETATVEPGTDDALTLAELVKQLGADILDVIAAPAGLDRPIGHPLVHDPTEELVADTGDVILAVGLDAGSREFPALLERAGELGVAAVIVKVVGEVDERATEVAQRCGPALLGVTPSMSWGQLHTLLRTSLLRAGASPEPLPGGVAVGDLFGLANAVSAMVGGAVTIEDPQSRVLAYSSYEIPLDEPRRETILGRRVPRYWIDRLNERGVFRRLWTGDDVVLIEGLEPPPGEPPLRRRLAIAVRAGDEILGSIWVAEGDRPFTDESEAALRQAAQLAALHLVRHRSGEDLDRKMRADLLRSLLEGRGALNLLADRLGVDPNGRFCVVAFEVLAADDAGIALQRERALQLVALHCEAFRRRAVQTAIGRIVYALLPLGDDVVDDSVRRLVGSIVDRSGEVLAVELRVGIGPAVDHLRAAASSRAQADQVLRVLETSDRPSPAVASFDDVRATALLLELRDVAEERPELREGKLRALIDHDGDRASAYVDTLRAYLRHFGDVPAAATEIAVHPNTFRYRLKRLCEIADLHLDDPDERLITELQLRLL